MAKRKSMGSRLLKYTGEKSKPVLLLCAETEEKYLRDLIAKYDIKNIQIRNRIASTPNKETLKRMEKKVQEPFDSFAHIYHIFDLERPDPKDGQVKGMVEHIKNCKTSKYVTTIVQMTCIETWFLWIMGVKPDPTYTAQDCEKAR